ncbi:hatching enzyme 1.2-like isoform X2 [Topomyia yanbarensis]|uniref:hatching enzyme 1.2-like isoform X2 n=1 Tax=Topomyia yanbarensis TaxID=2498891 RepID=UPI00273B73DF|nr:hatching enzyme 1.2-like isoform X2 [Topomyia yanbarensis]XP_058839891.1 hatching enzyme 1.2-like isoform X2 [Topomyia yanbarensis]
MARRLVLTLLATWLALAQSGLILRDENEVDGEGDAEDEIDLSHLGMGIYGEPDESVGERVSQYNPETDSVNPEELGTYVDGDILIARPAGRNGLADKSTRWPGAVVPFVISGDFRANEMQLIEDAFNEYHKKTCVKFKPRMGEKDYISIESSKSGCWSSVGRIGGRQEVNLQIPGCTTKVGTIVHELMHAVGFLHEQNRSERDDWVKIQTQNIQRGTETNFLKAKSGTTDAFGVKYDYGSVMHYSATAFSSNGQPTIIAKKSGGNRMGQRNGFSQGDIDKINKMYGCKGVTGGALVSTKPTRPARPVKKPAGNGPTGAQVVGFIGNLIGAAFGDNETESAL